jgi:hypothetical protein
MQIKVANSIPAAPLNITQLAQDLPVAYAKTQPAPLVPQKIYDAPFGTSSKDNYAQIFTGSLTQPYFQMQGSTFAINGVSLVSGGSGYATLPTVTLTAPPAGGTQATAVATINAKGVVDSVILTNPGLGYSNTVPLTATFSAPPAGGTRATATVSVNAFKLINKAIQELFDPIYGRMNATLAVELPFTSQANATTIPLAYIDTPVESLDAIKDGETQIWKITHNGVDSHPVHFHLMNVQLINRVDWAGVIKPPQAGEMGWKETITMNPLEDVYVAARAVRPVTPFGLPTSTRLLDPSQAVSSKIMFTNLDPVTGQTPTFQRQLVNGVNTDVPTAEYSNQMTDFDNEYVWHCHILGHEENDFMRPMIFHPTVILPDAPGAVTVAAVAGGQLLTWADPTPVGGWDKDGIPTAGVLAKPVNPDGTLGAAYAVEPTNNAKNEIGFQVARTLSSTVTTTTPAVAPAVLPTVTTATTKAVTLAMVPANATSWLDKTALPANSSTPADANGVTTDTRYTVGYDVVAYNAAGNSVAGKTVVQAAAAAALAAPVSTAVVAGSITAPVGLAQAYTAGKGTTLTWGEVAGASGYVVSVGAAAPVLVSTNSFSLGGAASRQLISVAAVVNGVTGAAASAYNGLAYTPLAFKSSNGAAGAMQPGSITLTWANSPLNVNNVTGLGLSWSRRGSSVVMTKTFPPNSTGVTIVGLSPDQNYNISLIANGVIGNSLPVTQMVLSAP